MNTDLRFLACDAWLCPVSETMELSPHWQRSIRACELPERPHDWGTSTSGSTTGTRVVRCLPRTEAALRRRREQRYKQYEHPEPYLALVMGRGLSIAQRAQTLHEFLNKVAEELPPTSRFGRALPLVAVPIFGAGIAAEDVLRGDEQSGEIIESMLRELHAFASSHACDVALCTVDPSAFGAAQQARRRLLGARSADRLGRLYRLRAPVDLVTRAAVDRYEAEVDRLALLLLNGQTSLFLGAGVSINAGLPSWAALIDLLALELAISPEDRTSLARLNPLEAASLCAARAGSEAELKRLCARIVGSATYYLLLTTYYLLLRCARIVGSATYYLLLTTYYLLLTT